MVTQEFQAIVLAAGRGSRLLDVIGDSPKCLLPVGPYPLLWYPLNMLQQHNFQECIVVVLEREKAEIQQALEHTQIKMKLDFVAIPNDSDFGTADSLRYIHDKIKSDFIVLTCDIVSNVSLYPLINTFRQHDATVTALMFQSGFESDVTVPGPKSKAKPERDLIGIHPDSHRLLFMASASDFENEMTVNAHLLRKNGKMVIYSRLMDSHIYVMKKWVIDFLKKKEAYSTLKSEFLPYLLKKQMHRPRGTNVQQENQSELGVNTRAEDDVNHYASHSVLVQQIQKTTLYNDSRIKEPYNGDLVRCFAIQVPKDCIGVRVNTTLSFYAINQKIHTIWSQLCGDQILHPLRSANAIINSTQTKEIAAGAGAKLSEKTSLNCSVFGSNCVVNPKTVINKTVIFGNAVVEEGCNLDNCIIGYNAIVKKGSALKNCVIGAKFVVEEGSKLQMQYLTHADRFMEIDIQ